MVITQPVFRFSCRLKGHSHVTQDEAEECIRRTTWLSVFDDRQQAEIGLAVLYAEQFAHGTDGHNVKLIIAKMVTLLGDLNAPPGGQGVVVVGGASWTTGDINVARKGEDVLL